MPASCILSIASADAMDAALTSSAPNATGGDTTAAFATGPGDRSDAAAGLHAATSVPVTAATAPFRRNERRDSRRDTTAFTASCIVSILTGDLLTIFVQ